MNEIEKLRAILQDGKFHTSDSLGKAGVSRMTVKRATETGDAIQFARGLYVDPDCLGVTGIDFAALSAMKEGVVCLLSAAQFHDLGDENPAQTWFAVDRAKVKNAHVASFRQPHRIVFWSGPMLEIGVERHEIMGQEVRITDKARTVVDLLRYRNKLGDETAVRAFSDFLKSGGNMGDVWTISEQLGVRASLLPFFRMADEIKESLPTRSPM